MKKIDYLVMDVDGTLTDGKIYIGNYGELCKTFNVKDGYGIHDIAIPAGMTPVIMTGRTSSIVENRCTELGITELYQGVHDKVIRLRKIANDLCQVAYIGDDINDLDAMKAVKEDGGLVGCPADAAPEVIEIADFVATRNGGEGAVREFIDWIVN